MLTLCSGIAYAATDTSEQDVTSGEPWAVHGQLTNVIHKHPNFTSPYSGESSLIAKGRAEETTDVTLYAGIRLWRGAELWLNPEIDQGFGLSNTVGIAGFPSGEAYKVGADTPYLRLPRTFIRQMISLGGDMEKTESGANQLAGTKSSDNLTLTLGKFSVVDMFGTNTYAQKNGERTNLSAAKWHAKRYGSKRWRNIFHPRYARGLVL